jgi:hypothetical protein
VLSLRVFPPCDPSAHSDKTLDRRLEKTVKDLLERLGERSVWPAHVDPAFVECASAFILKILIRCKARFHHPPALPGLRQNGASPAGAWIDVILLEDGGRYRIRTYDFHRVKMALYR